VKPSQCALVQGSTLRSSTKPGRTAARAPAGAAHAPATAAEAPTKTTEGRAPGSSGEASDSYDDDELEEAPTKVLELLMDEMAKD
jgi:hypothetical protein